MKVAAGYTGLQKVLHWAVVGMIALNYTLFEEIGRAFRGVVRDGVYDYNWVVIGHIAMGAGVLVFALWRMALKVRLGAPAAPENEPELFKKLAVVGHLALYAIMILMPVSGMVAWFTASGSIGEVHEIMKPILIALVVIHVGAVAAHKLVWKTDVPKRMF
ncbi:cytochrome b/b6 domain-containing protein [Mesobacterium sp. TK19101]|uniref:Cytochrome b/b6 domain-containing protein n=1 Tax=Mesobacterium hydrothermale TaxID=3111907 RepID=A0ABU6HFJ8_9RHOB|nr:cytochrome b/b6 domain-containing protein [Mesobacterium sp. TK19101]MEC3861225.1 cytochrome b/b6 domain-containing protein [Mesobacterium sp. TK19101]